VSFDFHVHGLWILGGLFFFVAGIMAGNLQWVEGATSASFGISAVLIFLSFLIAAAFWISAAVNARHEEFRSVQDHKCDICLHIHKNGHVDVKRHAMEEVPRQ